MRIMIKRIKKIKNQLSKIDSLLDLAAKEQQTSNELLWANIFRDTIQGSSWFVKQNVSPGRWALGYPALYILYRILNDVKPKSILEFGLGESSKLTYQYKISSEDVKLMIIEQDDNWLHFFSENNFDVKEYTRILPIKKETFLGHEINIYDGLLESINERKYNLILIDGPWGSPNYSRKQILDIIENDLLDKEFIILIDDSHRIGEQQTISELKKKLQNKKNEFVEGCYSGQKSISLICSENYKFITSL